jgi:hypothetical protein
MGSVVALIFAFLAVRASHRTVVQQGVELSALQEDRTRAQAARIATWTYIAEDGRPMTCLRNGSDLPIFAVFTFVGLFDATGKTWWNLEPLAVMPPGNREKEISLSELPFQLLVDPRPLGYGVRSSVAFTDCQGRTWLRNAFGELSPLIEADSDRLLYNLHAGVWIHQESDPLLRKMSGPEFDLDEWREVEQRLWGAWGVTPLDRHRTGSS